MVKVFMPSQTPELVLTSNRTLTSMPTVKSNRNPDVNMEENSTIQITILYDNNNYNRQLRTSWGFASLIEGLDETILFDTGGDISILLSNMHQLKINPEDVDVIIISHIHHDHVGGLSGFLKTNPKVRVYLPKTFPESIKNMVRGYEAKMVEVGEPMEICENAYSSGELGISIIEQSLIIKTEKGLVIITGCSHPGIVNIVKHVKKEFGNDIYLILGGFHLSGLTRLELNEIINEIRQLGVIKVAPCHCSGDLARNLFEIVYGENFILAGVGKKIEISSARK